VGVDSNILGLVELLLIVGLVFGFGLWQLYTLRRDKREPPRRDRQRDPGRGGPPASDDRD
jgi:hypothetical protein